MSCEASRVRATLAGLGAAAAVLAGCASEQAKIAAINDVNQAFRADYERILAEKGSRVYPLPRAEAFVAMRVALAGLGMHTVSQDSALGYLSVVAPAPRPLDGEEWRRAGETDLPRLRRLVAPHVGMLSQFIRFEPEGLQVVISATIVETPGGAEIALTARMREVAPPRSGFPRREYLPPTALRLGVDKIWQAFEEELRLVAQRP